MQEVHPARPSGGTRQTTHEDPLSARNLSVSDWIEPQLRDEECRVVDLLEQARGRGLVALSDRSPLFFFVQPPAPRLLHPPAPPEIGLWRVPFLLRGLSGSV